MRISFHVWEVSKDRRSAEQIARWEEIEHRRRVIAASLAKRAAEELAAGASVVSILMRHQAG